MEIELRNVERLATSYDVTRAIAEILHSESFVATYRTRQSRPVNFQVVLSPDTVTNSIRNGGTGILTIPYLQLAKKFLIYLHTRRIKVAVFGRSIHFSQSPSVPRRRLLDTLAKVFLPLCLNSV